jgi:choline-sulfatase
MGPPEVAVARSPNILVLMSDQHRADMMGCAGDPAVKTPVMDRLAAEGVRFSRAICQGPLCMPARASLLTERYVRDHGVFQNNSEVGLDMPTGVQSLREAGYHTAVIGKTHLWAHGDRGRIPVSQMRERLVHYGFDEVHETVGKLANLAHPNPYTEYLESAGLLAEYRSHVGARSYGALRSDEQPRERRPMWDATPIELPLESYVDAWHGRRVVRWIDEYAFDRPFFLFVGFPGPHDPWDAPREAVDPYLKQDVALPGSTRRPEPRSGVYGAFLRAFLGFSNSDTLTDERIRQARRAYYGDVSIIDSAIGDILDALARRGALDDTWVVYTTDHGEMMGEHGLLAKMVFYAPAVRIPLIVRPPGGCAARVVAERVEQFDLSATCSEIAGARPVPGSEARSLLPVIRGDAAAPTRPASVSENFGFALFETDRWKLVVWEDDLTPVSLFDVVEDPLEDHERIDDPAFTHTVEELMERHVRPFFRTPPARPHRSAFDRA